MKLILAPFVEQKRNVVPGPDALRELSLVFGVIIEGLEGAEDLGREGFGIRRPPFHRDEAGGFPAPPEEGLFGPLQNLRPFCGRRIPPAGKGVFRGPDGLFAEGVGCQAGLPDRFQGCGIFRRQPVLGFFPFVADDQTSVHRVTISP